MAEIRDDSLFTQPDESYLGECPICCLPLSLAAKKYTINSCCCKYICDGCCHANMKREREQGLEMRCPYCREPIPKTKEEAINIAMKRVEANDPIGLCQVGAWYNEEGDYETANEYYTKAAALGDVTAHHNLSVLYRKGLGVEKDLKKELYHLEEAAIGGHSKARHNLGCYENDNGRVDRATRHFVIAANLGHDGSLETVKKGFMDGLVSKEDFEKALRGHQAAVDATKSKQREEATRRTYRSGGK